MIYYVINITSTKVKLFSIRYRINQVVQVLNVKNIIIITDVIYTIRYIFDLSPHLYQLYSITVFQSLRAFFNKSSNNSINFWDFSSNAK